MAEQFKAFPDQWDWDSVVGSWIDFEAAEIKVFRKVFSIATNLNTLKFSSTFKFEEVRRIL